jgi:hypothetical protein
MDKTKKSGLVSRLTRNIDAWWRVNWTYNSTPCEVL